MKIFVTGGTGFVGSALSDRLVKEGHEVSVLTRRMRKKDDINFIEGDPTKAGRWQNNAAEHDVIINLAGAPIFKRWSKGYKQIIRDSRIHTTRNIVNALKKAEGEKQLINASAAGYYGFHGDEILTEKDDCGNDFLARLADEWERTALKAKDYGVRVVLCRFGTVLGKGGMLDKIIPAAKYNLISPLGSGMQWISWIHIRDLVNIFIFLLENQDIEGAVNCTSPNPIRNREFMETLAEVMNKRIILPRVPEFMLKLVMGELAELIVNGQRTYPERLLNEGFRFEFPYLKDALKDIF